MAVIDEIRDQQKKAFKSMNFREKAGYIWYYYKVHILLAIVVLLFVGTFIQQITTSIPYGFYATLVNADTPFASSADELGSGFAEYAGIDTDEYQVFVDTSVQMSENQDAQYSITSREKLLLQLQTGEVHTLVADTEIFESYAQNEFFYDLSQLLTEDELAAYADAFYYTDAATFDIGTEDPLDEEAARLDLSEEKIDHHDPASMENPIPVGIFVTDFSKIRSSGFYDYLSDNHVTFQKNPSEAVLGIPVTIEDTTLATAFIHFLATD